MGRYLRRLCLWSTLRHWATKHTWWQLAWLLLVCMRLLLMWMSLLMLLWVHDMRLVWLLRLAKSRCRPTVYGDIVRWHRLSLVRHRLLGLLRGWRSCHLLLLQVTKVLLLLMGR